MATTPKRISALTSATTPLAGTEVVAIVQSGTTKKVAADDIAALTYSFKTIDCPSGTDPVADSSTDTLTLSAGTGMTITGDSSTDTVTFSHSAREIVHVRDQQTAGTDAGGFTSGSWQTRTLNTVVTNTITGASLSSNQLTLPAGTYRVRAHAPGHYCNRHQARLRNVTDGATLVVGTSAFSPSGTSTSCRSLVNGVFTLAGSKAIELQHRCQTTKTTDGFGVAVNFDEVEVYGEVLVEKIP